ncbi:MAG: polysaccharide deacetylase family protein [Pseudomonadota bacterium]
MLNNRLLIVNYHYIRDTSYQYPGIHPLTLKAFEEQVLYLKSLLTPATPDEILNFTRGRFDFQSPAVFLTFDDGLRDHLVVAEILNALGMHAAFFVSSQPLLEERAICVHKVHWLRAHTDPRAFRTEFIEYLMRIGEAESLTSEQRRAAKETYIYDTQQDAELKYLINFQLKHELVDVIASQMLESRGINEKDFCNELYITSEDDLNWLVDAGHVIGCHGHRHRPFSKMTYNEAAEDIEVSCTELAKYIGRNPDWVSYPYGSDWAIPAEPELFCQRHGFSIGLTLKRDWNFEGQSAFAMNRINTNEVRLFVEG